jgi:hypothetical protein
MKKNVTYTTINHKLQYKDNTMLSPELQIIKESINEPVVDLIPVETIDGEVIKVRFMVTVSFKDPTLPQYQYTTKTVYNVSDALAYPSLLLEKMYERKKTKTTCRFGGAI